jgi:hypothetical protein
MNHASIKKPNIRRRWLGATALSFGCLAATALLPVPLAFAVDATWQGNGAPTADEWNQTNNWSANALPTGTATFANNAAPTTVTVRATGAGSDVTLDQIQFNAGAPAYTIQLGSGAFPNPVGRALTLNGAGIVNNSSNALSIDVSGSFGQPSTLTFNNTSTAANTIISVTSSVVNFNNSSTAATATIFIGGFAVTNFFNTSTAANANITTHQSEATTVFHDTSTAGNATITNVLGATFFTDSSTAGNATITTSTRWCGHLSHP